MQVTATFVLAGFTLLTLNAYAHVGHGFPEVQNQEVRAYRRSLRLHNRSIRVRSDTPNESSFASIKDRTQECNGYSLPQSHDFHKAYPKSNEIAYIMDNDDTARSVWNDIKASGIIPDHVEVKEGTDRNQGISDSQSDSYSDKDPDCWWTATTCTKPKADGLSEDIVSCPEPGTWGLTFDDGPDCGHNEFYDFLQQQKLKATMFYIGGNVLDNPLQAQRGLADGHNICVHTWSHHYTTTLEDENVFAELYYTMRVIKDVIGVTPRCWRPPYGDVDDRVRAIATGLGLRTIIWDQDTDDWDIQPEGDSSTQKIDSNYDKIVSLASSKKTDTHGIVVLNHELNKYTMSEFMKEYPKVKDAFPHVVPLSACFNATKPYPEDGPTYSTFNDYISGKIDANNVPDMAKFQIQVGSKMDIVTLSNQTDVGGFSPQSKPNKNANDATSADASPSSSTTQKPTHNSGTSPTISLPTLWLFTALFFYALYL